MRSRIWFGSLIVGLALVLVGCGKNESGIDVSKLQNAFSSANAPAKAEVDKAITAIKAGEYSQALSSLGAAAKEAKLTPEQQAAINDVVGQVKAKVKGAVQEGAEQAKKAAGALQDSISK